MFPYVARMRHVRKELYISTAAIFGGRPQSTSVSLYQSIVGIVHYAEKRYRLFQISLSLGRVWLRLFARPPLSEEGKESAIKRFQKALSHRL